MCQLSQEFIRAHEMELIPKNSIEGRTVQSQSQDLTQHFTYTRQGPSQKKLMTGAMSMKDLWIRQSVYGWVLFLGIKSVYNDYKQQKWKKLPRQVPRLACY